MEEKQEEKKLDKIKLEDLDLGEIEYLLSKMRDVGLITEQGFRIQGMGLVLRKLDRISELIDKTNLKLYYIEKKFER